MSFVNLTILIVHIFILIIYDGLIDCREINRFAERLIVYKI